MVKNQCDTHAALMDVVIVGGGYAGCHAAIALGRTGHKVTLIDINAEIPALFRAEKISGDQLPMLHELGLFEEFKAISSPVTKFINIRGRHIIDRRNVEEYGILYPAMVELLRSLLPSNVEFRIERVSDIRTTYDIQHVTLASGENIDTRLIILATGYGEALRRKLGAKRHQIHPLRTVCAGFTLAPPVTGFRFPALTAYGEKHGDGVDYISFFPLGNKMRANLFMFADIRDPRVIALSNEGLPALLRLLPGLQPWLAGCELAGDVAIFPVEICKYDNVIQNGVVLIGDAFRTSCPAVGSGLSCSMHDVIRLLPHVERWLKTPGMSAEKITTFYSDPLKTAQDSKIHRQAMQRREAIMGTAFTSRLLPEVRFAVRRLRDRLLLILGVLKNACFKNRDYLISSHGDVYGNR